MQIDSAFLIATLESLRDPFVLVDTDHVIRFMNEAGARNYHKWGGRDLIGKSLMDCHNEQSQAKIREIVVAMAEGEEERMISSKESRRIFMRAVRGEDGALLGYYERYEYAPFADDL